jgi:hypothetical protein
LRWLRWYGRRAVLKTMVSMFVVLNLLTR